MAGDIKPLEYKEDLFVDREEETTQVLEIVKGLLHVEHGAKAPDKRLVILMGERGTGKTWLLRHIETQIRRQYGSKVAILRDDLRRRQEVPPEPSALVMNLIKKFWEELGGQVHFGQGLEDMSRYFMEFLREQVLPTRVLVLLLDHVLESDWQLLDILEDYLLSPLLAESRTLVVITGRKRTYPWKTPLLRMQSMVKELGPFSKEYTQEQLRKQVSKVAKKADEIYDITGGIPLANYLVAKGEEKGSRKMGVEKAIDELLAPLPGNMREYVVALSEKDTFRDDDIRNIRPGELEFAEASRIRRTLTRLNFAYWDEKRRVYVLDEGIRALLHRGKGRKTGMQ